MTIAIRPLGDGWTVQVDGVSNDMVYRNGTDAEAAARALGETLIREGQPTEIHLFLRDGGLAARLVCAPQTAGATPSWEARS